MFLSELQMSDGRSNLFYDEIHEHGEKAMMHARKLVKATNKLCALESAADQVYSEYLHRSRYFAKYGCCYDGTDLIQCIEDTYEYIVTKLVGEQFEFSYESGDCPQSLKNEISERMLDRTELSIHSQSIPDRYPEVPSYPGKMTKHSEDPEDDFEEIAGFYHGKIECRIDDINRHLDALIDEVRILNEKEDQSYLHSSDLYSDDSDTPDDSGVPNELTYYVENIIDKIADCITGKTYDETTGSYKVTQDEHVMCGPARIMLHDRILYKSKCF